MFIDLSEFIFHQKKLKYSDLRPLWAPCWSCAQFPDTSIMLCLPKTIGYRQEPTSFFHTKTTFLSSRKFKLPPKPCFICVSLTPYAWILRIFHVKITNKNDRFLAFCKCTLLHQTSSKFTVSHIKWKTMVSSTRWCHHHSKPPDISRDIGKKLRRHMHDNPRWPRPVSTCRWSGSDRTQFSTNITPPKRSSKG